MLEDGGIYHIYSRGNNRKWLFRDKDDFRFYKELLADQRDKYSYDLYHYCLMTNHIHMLLRIKQGDELPRLMHGVQLGYTRYYRKKYKYLGHLYQGRFRSPRIADESYYLQCGRYIERNPVKAGVVEHAADYPYSSAADYVLGISDSLVTHNPYYLEMGKTFEERQKNYELFVSLDEPYREMVDAGLARV